MPAARQSSEAALQGLYRKTVRVRGKTFFAMYFSGNNDERPKAWD
jgi:hypothetical protein